MTVPAHHRYLYTIPTDTGAVEHEMWSGSTDRDELKATVALTHGVRVDQITVRKAPA